ncbi:putative late blight resistance proteinR1A-3 [Sesamum angolense]|uniref:Late blight resistance proteinR1A-3 n=1 Tax=Sesamum angolense TaxID=2727404 RepID=A0AAE1WK05_9LAMI|nr:putative late blight resistance proteinR1A-3 [Sesamum angolense]
MADGAVEYIIRNLQQLLFHQAHLIAHARSDVEKLEKHLQFFKAFLKDTTKKWRKSDSMQKLIRDIRDVVYEAEDIVDAFVIVAAESSYRTYFRRAFKKPVKLLTIAKKVEAVVDKIKVIKTDINFANFSIDVGDEGPAGPEAPNVKQVNVVGFNHEAEEIIGYLLEETQYFDVISITGMPGLGKTTLAAKIFCDHAIRSAFPICIWIYISQEFRKKDVFLSILKEFTKIDDNISRKSDQEEDWSKLKIAFPVSNKDGKVLITSRHDEVAQFANLHRTPHHMRLLTQDESWMLLQYEVFGALPCPPELEDLGKLIAKHCCGLPLAIVVIAGILTIKFKESDKIATEAMFPEDFEIPVWKLLRMWIAEGFVQKMSDIGLEETAEIYLQDLIDRNLLRVDKRRSDGRVKTCRIHDMLRDFCKNEAGIEKDNFLQEVKRIQKD